MGFTSIAPLQNVLTCVPDNLKTFMDFIQTWHTHVFGSGFIYLGLYVAFNTVQVISRWVVGRAEETSTYNWSRFCKLLTNGKQLPAFPFEVEP